MSSAEVRKRIVDVLQEVMMMNQIEAPENITGDTLLVDTGLDSIGFATMVALLEVKLGYDPFILMEEAIYPRTFGEFTSIYDEYKHLATSEV